MSTCGQLLEPAREGGNMPPELLRELAAMLYSHLRHHRGIARRATIKRWLAQLRSSDLEPELAWAILQEVIVAWIDQLRQALSPRVADELVSRIHEILDQAFDQDCRCHGVYDTSGPEAFGQLQQELSPEEVLAICNKILVMLQWCLRNGF